MQKADSNSSAGAKADSTTKDENIFVSSHDTKPNVVGSQIQIGTSIESVKLNVVASFGTELTPIITQLNSLLKKYKINPIKDIISFTPVKNEIVPFINYDSFPGVSFHGAFK